MRPIHQAKGAASANAARTEQQGIAPVHEHMRSSAA